MAQILFGGRNRIQMNSYQEVKWNKKEKKKKKQIEYPMEYLFFFFLLIFHFYNNDKDIINFSISFTNFD